MSRERLRGLRPEELLLVDDERENVEGAMRYCKVARYDEVYRNCGPLNQPLARPSRAARVGVRWAPRLGGLGAHSRSERRPITLI